MRSCPVGLFLLKVNFIDGHWLWNGGRNNRGYGMFWDMPTKRWMTAHRWSYEHFIGSVPNNNDIHHICEIKHCVRPGCLAHMPNCENRKIALDKITHCPQGHLYTEENMFKGTRWCRECGRIRTRDYKKRIRQSIG